MPGSPGRSAPAKPTSMMRRVRAKVVISEGLTVVVGMNGTQSVGSGNEDGSFFVRQSLDADVFDQDLCLGLGFSGPRSDPAAVTL